MHSHHLSRLQKSGLYLLGWLVIAACFLIFLPMHKVAADACPNIPCIQDTSSDHYDEVAKQGTDLSLNAPSAYYRVYSKQVSGNNVTFTVTVEGCPPALGADMAVAGCTGSYPDNADDATITMTDAGNPDCTSPTSYTLQTANAASQTMTISHTYPLDCLQQDADSQYYSVQLVISIPSTSLPDLPAAVNANDLSSDGALYAYKLVADTANEGKIYYDANQQPGGSEPFAEQARGASGESNFQIPFTGSCTVAPNQTAELYWQDADGYPSMSPQNWDIYFYLTNGGVEVQFPEQNGTVVTYTGNNPSSGIAGAKYDISSASNPDIGGQGTPRSIYFPINPGDSYTWYWHDVDYDNGIQFNVPADGVNPATSACPGGSSQPTPVTIAGNVYGNDSGKVNNLTGVSVTVGCQNSGSTEPSSASTGSAGGYNFTASQGDTFCLSVPTSVTQGGVTYTDPVITDDTSLPSKYPPDMPTGCSSNQSSWPKQLAATPSTDDTGGSCSPGNNGAYSFEYTYNNPSSGGGTCTSYFTGTNSVGNGSGTLVTNTTASPGQSRQVQSSLSETNDCADTLQWTAHLLLNGNNDDGALPNTTSGTGVAFNADQTQTLYDNSGNFTIPANAKNGDQYCFYLSWTKAGGSETDDQSGKACITVEVTPKTCTSYFTGTNSVGNGSGTLVTNTTASPGQSRQVQSSLSETNDCADTLQWTAHLLLNGNNDDGALPNTTSGTGVAFNADQTQTLYDNSGNFTIPANAKNGDQYCFYLSWTKAGGSETDDQSGKACITVEVTPIPITVSGIVYGYDSNTAKSISGVSVTDCNDHTSVTGNPDPSHPGEFSFSQLTTGEGFCVHFPTTVTDSSGNVYDNPRITNDANTPSNWPPALPPNCTSGTANYDGQTGGNPSTGVCAPGDNSRYSVEYELAPTSVTIQGKIYYYDKTTGKSTMLNNVPVYNCDGHTATTDKDGTAGQFSFPMTPGQTFCVEAGAQTAPHDFASGGVTYTDPIITPNSTSGTACSSAPNDQIYDDDQVAADPSSGTCAPGNNTGYNIAYTSTTTICTSSCPTSNKPCPTFPNYKAVTVTLPDNADTLNNNAPSGSTTTPNQPYTQYTSDNKMEITAVSTVTTPQEPNPENVTPILTSPALNSEVSDTNAVLDYTPYVDNYPYDQNIGTVTYVNYYDETAWHTSSTISSYSCNTGDSGGGSSETCTHTSTYNGTATKKCTGSGSKETCTTVYTCNTGDSGGGSSETCTNTSTYNGQAEYDWQQGATTKNVPTSPATADGSTMPACYNRTFQLTPNNGTLNWQGSTEDPTGVVYSGSVDEYFGESNPDYVTNLRQPYSVSGGSTYPINTTTTMYVYHVNADQTLTQEYQLTGCSPSNLASSYTSSSTASSYDNPNYAVPASGNQTCSASLTSSPPLTYGDMVCASLGVDVSDGQMDPSGNIQNVSVYETDQPGQLPQTGDSLDEVTGSDTYCTPPLAAEPYFKVFGGDVLAGVTTEDTASCYNTTAPIEGQSYNGTAGAGTQLAAVATNSIESFATAQFMAENGLSPPNGLAFANTSSPPGDYGTGTCPSDAGYYEEGEGLPNTDPNFTASETVSDALSDSTSPGQYVYHVDSDGDAIGPVTIPSGQHITIYVDGSLTIDGDITYGSSDSTNPNDLPSLTIITNSAPINIDHNVTELYGNYIAENGTIDDCADENGSTVPAFYDSDGDTSQASGCSQKLTIVGSLVANRIALKRTLGTVHDSSLPEYPGTPTAAEEIDYSPLDWLVPQPSKLPTVESVTSLPPIL